MAIASHYQRRDRHQELLDPGHRGNSIMHHIHGFAPIADEIYSALAPIGARMPADRYTVL
jgi:hypothetical protein